MLVDVGYYLLHGVVLLVLWAACSFALAGALGSRAWLRAGKRAAWESKKSRRSETRIWPLPGCPLQIPSMLTKW